MGIIKNTPNQYEIMQSPVSDTNLLQLLAADLEQSQKGPLGHTPLYHQLYLIIKSAILNGTIPANTLLPGEHILASNFDVSRITVKRALDELASEKLVIRSRGKGTRTSRHHKPKPVHAPLVDMLENLIEMGENSIVHVESIHKIVPPPEIRELLELEKNHKVHRVVRVRSNENGEPFAYYVSYTKGITKGFTKKILESTPRLNVLKQNGIQLTEVEQVLSAENATVQIAGHLEAREGDALLSIRRKSRDQHGQIVDVLDCWYNPKRYQYAMTLTLD